ncbi:hypothetical protein NL676_005607 [Syzygium grande]|nr:hypothetical protein NL676_005607 [Syzygium grande]
MLKPQKKEEEKKVSINHQSAPWRSLLAGLLIRPSWGSESTTLLCLFDGPEGGTVDPLGKKLKTRPRCRKLVTPSWRRGRSRFMAIRDNAGDTIPRRVAEQELARSRIRTATPRSLDRRVPDLDQEDEDGEARAQRSYTRPASSSDGLREPRPYSMSSSGTGPS